MATFFRKLLIRIGKVIPFVFAFIVVISHIESGIVVGIASFMALAGLYCVYGGMKIILSSQK